MLKIAENLPSVLVSSPFNLSSLQTNTDIFANSADHHEPLIMIYTVFEWNPYLQQWTCPNLEMEESMSETQGWKGSAEQKCSTFTL